MAMSLRVNLEHLAASAMQVSGHGEDLAARQLAVDNRIADAQPGWAGSSAEALAYRASRWAAKSTALVTRIGEHANDLYSAGLAFSTMDAINEENLSSEVLG
jgi:uncharacterized protein YukE